MRNFIKLQVLAGFVLVAFWPSNVYAFHAFGSNALQMQVTLDSAEVYDDNVTYASANEKSDFITEFTAGLEAVYEGKNQDFSIGGRTRQQLFAKNTSFRNNAQFANLDYRYEFSHYDRIRLTDRFSNQDEPGSFDDAFEGGSGRYSRVRNSFDIDYEKDISKRVTVIASYGNEFSIFSTDNQQDSFANSAGLNGLYFLSSETVLLSKYQFLYQSFEEAGLRPSADFSSHTIAGGLRRFLTEKLYLDGFGGLDLYQDFDDSWGTGIYAQAALNLDVDERTKMKLISFEMNTRASSSESTVFESWRLSADLSHEFTERFRGSVAGFYGIGKFSELDIEDDLFGANAGLEYEIREALKVSASYSFTLVNSDLKSREYTRNVVRIRMSYEF